jgi:muramoyltetrapeptide carboxypeptidase
MVEVIKPAALKKGDTIGIISPAGPVKLDELQSGLSLLETHGFEVRLGEYVLDYEGYLAGRDEKRLTDFITMFEDQEVTAVFSARGGYGSMRLLDGIDYGLIRDNPKIIVGYSDITALLLAIYKNAGLITFHGPVAREFQTKDGDNLDDLLKLLRSGKHAGFNLKRGACLVRGKAKGPMMGGNLSMICHLLGTPFMPCLDGCILFIEDRGESLYRIDRMLTHLRLSGQMNKLKGLVAGTFETCGAITEIEHLLKEATFDLGIPVATGLKVGHGSINLTVPIGITAELDTEQMILSIVNPVLTS